MPAIAFVTRRVYHDTEALIPYRTVNVSMIAAKYQGNRTYLKQIALHMHDLCLEVHADALQWSGATSCAITPVPSSIWRILRRGFDHMKIMAKHIQMQTHGAIQVLYGGSSPIRKTYTLDMPQASKSGTRRMTEVPRFIPKRNRIMSNHTHLILVDDVITTGTTLHSAEHALRMATNCRIVEKIAFAYSDFIQSPGCDRFD